jgi:hypothetical protein
MFLRLILIFVVLFLIAFEFIEQLQISLFFPPYVFAYNNDDAAKFLCPNSEYSPTIRNNNQQIRDGLIFVDENNGVYLHYFEIFPPQKIVLLEENGDEMRFNENCIFFLHGSFMNVQDHWLEEAKQLSESLNYSLITYDFRGYGYSNGAQENFDQCVNDAFIVFTKSMKMLMPKKIIIYAKDMGASIAVALAAKLVETKQHQNIVIVLETPLLGTKSLNPILFWPLKLCSEKLEINLDLHKTKYIKMIIGLAKDDIIVDNNYILNMTRKWRGLSDTATYVCKMQKSSRNNKLYCNNNNNVWKNFIKKHLK